MSKVRFQMFIEETQKEALEKLQQDSKISVAEMVRKAIDRFLTGWKDTGRLMSFRHICKPIFSCLFFFYIPKCLFRELLSQPYQSD